MITYGNDVPQDAREAGEDDIEAILADILNKEAKQTAVSNNSHQPDSSARNLRLLTLPFNTTFNFARIPLKWCL